MKQNLSSLEAVEITEVTNIKPINIFRQLRRAVASSVQFKYT